MVGLAAVIIAAMARRSPWPETLVGVGFLAFTAGWVGMYFRLKRESPEHPLAKATLIGRRAARRLFDLIGLHWRRHGLDIWTSLLIAGLVVFALSFVWR
jgi:hypothetical protein